MDILLQFKTLGIQITRFKCGIFHPVPFFCCSSLLEVVLGKMKTEKETNDIMIH